MQALTDLKLFQLYEQRADAKTDEGRRECNRLIEERIRLIGSGQDDGQ